MRHISSLSHVFFCSHSDLQSIPVFYVFPSSGLKPVVAAIVTFVYVCLFPILICEQNMLTLFSEHWNMLCHISDAF